MHEDPWKLTKKINSDPEFFFVWSQQWSQVEAVQLAKKSRAIPSRGGQILKLLWQVDCVWNNRFFTDLQQIEEQMKANH